MSLRSAIIALLFIPLLIKAENTSVQELLLDPTDSSRDRVIPIKVYLTPAETPRPVILFSHGLGGSRNNSVYLGEYWASHGYVAVFMQHIGSDESVWKSVPLRERLSTLKQAANLQATLDRYQDVPFVIDQLEKWNKEESHPLQGKLDLEKIGLTGHSFGAVTTQGLMGQKFMGQRTFKDPRIDAFLPMSPSASRVIASERAFSDITSPVLCMTGTNDGSPIDPNQSPESRKEVYSAMPAGDKYQLVFEGAEHSAFSDRIFPGIDQRIEHHHPTIQKISTRFWDAYLKDDASAKAWLQSNAVRKDCHLVEKDIWEWK